MDNFASSLDSAVRQSTGHSLVTLLIWAGIAWVVYRLWTGKGISLAGLKADATALAGRAKSAAANVVDRGDALDSPDDDAKAYLDMQLRVTSPLPDDQARRIMALKLGEKDTMQKVIDSLGAKSKEQSSATPTAT